MISGLIGQRGTLGRKFHFDVQTGAITTFVKLPHGCDLGEERSTMIIHTADAFQLGSNIGSTQRGGSRRGGGSRSRSRSRRGESKSRRVLTRTSGESPVLHQSGRWFAMLHHSEMTTLHHGDGLCGHIEHREESAPQILLPDGKILFQRTVVVAFTASVHLVRTELLETTIHASSHHIVVLIGAVAQSENSVVHRVQCIFVLTFLIHQPLVELLGVVRGLSLSVGCTHDDEHVLLGELIQFVVFHVHNVGSETSRLCLIAQGDCKLFGCARLCTKYDGERRTTSRLFLLLFIFNFLALSF
mmetsp:Transcript_3458/g.10728  ORF Transcript_3458/g.10728 Transcript_3458/m.10728 type:complete len:300 (+) Transcript_3458:1083-1982(+)